MYRLFLFLILLGSALPLRAVSLTARLADSLYQRGDYAGAAETFQQLCQEEGATATRLANLGNSYYQQGKLGHAVLAYEQAQLLDPRNGELRQVRAFLERKTVDKLPAPEGWLRRFGDQLAYALPLTAWLILAPLLFALSLVAGVLFALSSTPRRRRQTFYAGLGALVLAALAVAQVLHWTSALPLARSRAVVVLPEVNLYRVADATGQPLTKLHAGARLRLLSEMGDAPLVQVELSDGRQAWVARQALLPIAPLPGASDPTSSTTSH